jgi:hypothetical protein
VAGQQGGACLGRQKSSVAGQEEIHEGPLVFRVIGSSIVSRSARDTAAQERDFQETHVDGQNGPLDGERERQSAEIRKWRSCPRCLHVIHHSFVTKSVISFSKNTWCLIVEPRKPVNRIFCNFPI